MTDNLTYEPIKRDEWGCWVHPQLLANIHALFPGQEYFPAEDREKLVGPDQVIVIHNHELDLPSDEVAERGDRCKWAQPVSAGLPAGSFVVAIIDHEDGPFVWWCCRRQSYNDMAGVYQALVKRAKVELQANEHKGDFTKWKPSREELMAHIRTHVTGLDKALRRGNHNAVADHAADIVNYLTKAMLIGASDDNAKS